MSIKHREEEGKDNKEYVFKPDEFHSSSPCTLPLNLEPEIHEEHLEESTTETKRTKNEDKTTSCNVTTNITTRTTQTEEHNEHSLTMLATYLAASHSWQWRHLVLLTRQQLDLLEKHGRRRQYRPHSSRRKHRVLFSLRKKVSNPSCNSGSNLYHLNYYDHSSLYSMEERKPQEATAGISFNARIAQPQGSTCQDPPERHPITTSSALENHTNSATQHTQDLPTPSDDTFTPRRRAQNVFQNFPITTYIKIFIVLFFLNVPLYCILGVGLCGVIHALGTLNPFFRQLYQWLESTGLTQRRSFTEVMSELRSLRQQREQQRTAELQERRVYQELQEQAFLMSNPNTTTCESRAESNPHEELNQRSPSSTPRVQPCISCNLSQRLFYLARWFYQLVIAFFFSLNPQWVPLVAFIFPENNGFSHHTTTQSQTVSLETSSTVEQNRDSQTQSPLDSTTADPS